MTKEELKQYIDDNIYENVDGDISGDSLNEVLKAIVDDGGTKVEANPTGEATTPLNTIKIGETIYKTNNPFAGEVDVTDAERIQALANVNNQDAGYDSSEPPVFTGKMGYVVLQPETDNKTTFAAQIANKPNTIFEIRDVFDLGGTQETPVSVTIPANCTLRFNGGKLCNCIIIGNNTHLSGELQFYDVILDGTFKKHNSICTSVFQNNMNGDSVLLKNMSLVCENIELEDGSNLNIDKDGLEIYADSLFAKTNATLNFINIGATDGASNKTGLIIHPNNDKVLLQGLTITEDFPEEETPTTTGNAIAATKNIEISNCRFSGNSQSSFFAASRVVNFYAHDCVATSVKGDHLFYCSTDCKTFLIENISVEGTSASPVKTNAIFKVRNNNIVDFSAINVNTKNTVGYVYMLQDGCGGSLNLKQVVHTALTDYQENSDLFISIGVADKFKINIIDSNINCGSTISHSLIVVSPNAQIRSYNIRTFIDNSSIQTPNIQVCGFLDVENSVISIIGNNIVCSYPITIMFYNNVVNYNRASGQVFDMYKIQYSLSAIRCSFITGTGTMLYFVKNTKDANASYTNYINLVNTTIDTSKGLIGQSADSIQEYYLFEENCKINHGNIYNRYGYLLPVNINYGTTTNRPSLTNEDVGFGYFDTTLGKYICWNGTSWINLDGTYMVTLNIGSNIESSNDTDSAKPNKPYTTTLTAKSGFTIDTTSVVVTMGGTALSGVYDSGTGVITIPSITGNIVIMATATQNP